MFFIYNFAKQLNNKTMKNLTSTQKLHSVVSNQLSKFQCPECLLEEISDMRKQESKEFQSDYGDDHNEETNDWVNRGGY